MDFSAKKIQKTGVPVKTGKVTCLVKFTLSPIAYGVLMAFQLDFKGPYYNIRIRPGNALVVCDLYGLFLHSGHFSV